MTTYTHWTVTQARQMAIGLSAIDPDLSRKLESAAKAVEAHPLPDAYEYIAIGFLTNTKVSPFTKVRICKDLP